MSFVGTLTRLVYPNRCFLCREALAGNEHFCEECEGKMPYTAGELCLHCGKRQEECDCKNRSGALSGAVAPIYYVGRAAAGVRRLKYHGIRQYADLLGGLMANTVRADFAGVQFDGIVFVPMHPSKESMRGCSSARMLAHVLSEALGLPMPPSGLRHTGEGESQTKQSGREGRIENAKRNFRISRTADLEGKTLLLVDDILTTGATAERCAELMLHKGAKAVWLVCAATTREED